MAKDKQLDIVRDLVLGLIPRLDRRKNVEELAREVGKMYRVIFREVRDVEFEEFTVLAMPAAPEPLKRAKPYRPGGVNQLERPRILKALRDGREAQGARAPTGTRRAPKPPLGNVRGRIKTENGSRRFRGPRFGLQGLDRRP